jgi:16S rRNA (cytosine1402-N4)-methyltransferase
MSSVHVPVLLKEVLHGLELAPGQTVVDATVGGGGHSREIVSRIRPGGHLLGLDRDPLMLGKAAQALSGADVVLRQAPYDDLPGVLRELGWPPADRILADLGLSSDQLADASRSFSFQSPGELDLRFDRTAGRSAAELLATASVEELERIFREFGEEPHSRRIAEHLAARRRAAPLRSGADLADAVCAALSRRYRERERHPATRVFQALRIAVNEELDRLRRAMERSFPESLRSGGVLAVITFHSLEDRIVKQAFRDADVWEPLTPKPIEPRPAEIRVNPRSRSAKLRLARKR